MSGDFTPEFQRELLEDFHSESDELFRQIATQLVALEREPGNAPAAESLYRTVHTFKGICGIVGLRPAEELAHATEDALRSITRRESSADASALELLSRAIHRLEQIVAAHRGGQALPATGDLLEALQVFRRSDTAERNAPPAPVEEPLPSSPVAPAPANYWKATFAPSRELDARGVNVTQIRARLTELGPIVSAAPVVLPGSGMVFEFALQLTAAPAAPASWEADGVTWTPPAVLPAETSATAATSSETSPLSIAPSHLVRVDLGRLDELMRIMGQMVVHRSRLDDRIEALGEAGVGLQEVATALGRSLRDLRQAITRVRLVPVAEIFTRLPYVVKDLARENGRKVRLVLEGEETEIDKYLVERLKEPLLHLVRNAIGHGVETPAERTAAGKPEEATLALRASAAGQFVVIEIEDDGRGISPEAIAARARRAGIDVTDTPDLAGILDILCQPGFSTRDAADHTAGRGVGMAVVHATVRELGGRLSLQSLPGAGTRFTLRLPLTLSIADVVIVTAGDQICAVPQGAIVEVIQFEEADVRTVRQVEVVSYRDGVLPLIRLPALFGRSGVSRVRVPVLVLQSERGSTGLVVDRVRTQREVVVRPLADPLLQVPGIAGATELGDGRPILILDPNAFTAGVVRPPAASESRPATARQSA